ncbi:SAM and SH3 domain-containing protein 1-like isoform X4 [Anguilla anguilla]|uniref:SAM and SH3 domain-containing protein 1-like isoform X4 n=1 Tax=Anguilla anguilla TaxID=7936 RepID=UPI0015AD3AA8|nr:SAM and SH3 domain-containing protein 1-like isoform X4 [Anguilla anguilla]
MTGNGPTIVYEWLKTLQLCQYAESFVDNGYDDLEVCKQIGDPDLDAIGVFSPHHRQRIRAAVERLKEEDKDTATGVYFTLEPMPTSPDTYTSRKTEYRASRLKGSTSWTETKVDQVQRNRGGNPANRNVDNRKEPLIYPKLKLKIMIRDKLAKDRINLCQLPYSKKDGSLGNINDLAQEYAEFYNTCFSDVCDRMEELRRRRVSRDMDPEFQVKEETTTVSLQLRSEIEESLGFSSTMCTPETQRKLRHHQSSSEDGFVGKWDGKKRNRSFCQNVHKSQRGVPWQTSKVEEMSCPASEVTRSDMESIQLMLMVKDKTITVEEALAHLTESEAQNSPSGWMDRPECTGQSCHCNIQSSNCDLWEQSDDEPDELATLIQAQTLVSSSRQGSKKLIREEEEKTRLCSQDPGENTPPHGTGRQSKLTNPQDASLTSLHLEELSLDGDSDSRTTSLSSSSQDTWGSRKLIKTPGEPFEGRTHGLDRQGRGSGSSISEAECCCVEDPRASSVEPDGEMYGSISEGRPSSPPSLQQDSDPLETSMQKTGGSVESLRSSTSGQSSMSGKTVSTTDSLVSNRENVKLENGGNEELVIGGPFCGQARAHTDFNPNPYDSLKLRRGDIIDIISKHPMGTWMGQLNHKGGTFKFNYVDVLEEGEDKPKRPVRKRRKGHLPQPTSMEELLVRINLEEHMPTFFFNGYEDLDTFKLLEKEDLDELDIQDPQQRAVLLTAVELLQEYDTGDSGSESEDLSDSQKLLLSQDSSLMRSTNNLDNGNNSLPLH